MVEIVVIAMFGRQQPCAKATQTCPLCRGTGPDCKLLGCGCKIHAVSGDAKTKGDPAKRFVPFLFVQAERYLFVLDVKNLGQVLDWE